jgi:hypothetical protein
VFISKCVVKVYGREKPLKGTKSAGESSWRSVKEEKISVLEETDEYRKVYVEMVVADGYGVTNYDPSGSWGGGGEGPPYKVSYTAIEIKNNQPT